MSEPSKKSRKKRRLPEGVENLEDDKAVRLLFGDEAVEEMNRLVGKESTQDEDDSTDKE